MLPFQSHYWQAQNGLVWEPNAVATAMDGGKLTATSASKGGGKSNGEPCRSHKEAERRRRQRINAHLATLRTLLPNATKMDKASLLTEVVNRVRELRKRAADAAEEDGVILWRRTTTPESDTQPWKQFPSESDEATVSFCDDVVKATVCCDDRPCLNRDLTQAIWSAGAKAVTAEMATVGGRTKTVVTVRWPGACRSAAADERVKALTRGLKEVVENRVSGYGPAQNIYGNKRARFNSPLDGI